MRLLVIRHGQTHSNLFHALDTEAPGADLTDLGREQAEGLPGRLDGHEVDSIWVSNLVRTHQTAAPLAQALGIDPQIREGLREVRAGSLEMATTPEALREYIEGILAWADEPDLRLLGGETGTEVFERFDAVVNEAASSGSRTAALISHGAMMKTWAYAQNIIPQQILESTPGSIANTGIMTLEGSPGDWHLSSWDESPNGGPVLDFPLTARHRA